MDEKWDLQRTYMGFTTNLELNKSKKESPQAR